MCAPGMTEDEFFEGAKEWERPIFDVVSQHLDSLGDVFVEYVQVGVFFKNGPVFAELRPMKKWMALTFKLPIKVESRRLSRKVVRVGGDGSLWYHVVNIADPAQVDDQILDWLTESYFAIED